MIKKLVIIALIVIIGGFQGFLLYQQQELGRRMFSLGVRMIEAEEEIFNLKEEIKDMKYLYKINL